MVPWRPFRHVYSLGTLCNPCQRRMGAQRGADSTWGLLPSHRRVHSWELQPKRVGASCEKGGHEICCAHSQTPRRLLPFWHQTYWLQFHECSLPQRPGKRVPGGIPCRRNQSRSVFFHHRLAPSGFPALWRYAPSNAQPSGMLQWKPRFRPLSGIYV